MSTALVTGASSGIGLEIARILAKEHDVVLAARSADKLEALAQELGNARVVVVDLADPDGPRKLDRRSSDGRRVGEQRRLRRLGSIRRRIPGKARRDGRAQRRCVDAAHPRVPPGHGRARQRARHERRVDRGVPTRTADGRVLRDQGVRAVVLRSTRRRDARQWSHCDGAVPRAHRERLPVRRHHGGEPPGEGPQASHRVERRRVRREGNEPGRCRRRARDDEQSDGRVDPLLPAPRRSSPRAQDARHRSSAPCWFLSVPATETVVNPDKNQYFGQLARRLLRSCRAAAAAGNAHTATTRRPSARHDRSTSASTALGLPDRRVAALLATTIRDRVVGRYPIGVGAS